jgi:hypothetical protein
MIRGSDSRGTGSCPTRDRRDTGVRPGRHRGQPVRSGDHHATLLPTELPGRARRGER